MIGDCHFNFLKLFNIENEYENKLEKRVSNVKEVVYHHGIK